MSRTLTTAVANALVDDVVRIGFFVDLDFDSGNLRLWSGLGTITWNGYDWTGAGSLLTVSSLTETSELKAEGMTLTLSGVDATMISYALSEDYNNRPATVYFAVFDTTKGGAKITEISDPFEVFRGKMDVMSIKDGGDTAVIQLNVESRLIDLGRSKPQRYTNEYQKTIDATDKSLEFVAALQDKEFTWGPR